MTWARTIPRRTRRCWTGWAAEFVKSDYDIKELIGWIASSAPYSLTSQFGDDNTVDNPSAGEMPLFSHMYIKSMQAEQLYDSLISATNAHKSGKGGWEAQESQRRRWMQQFVAAFDTDENDEATTFNGTIPQALMMMNSELIEKAVNAERGSFLFETFSKPGQRLRKTTGIVPGSVEPTTVSWGDRQSSEADQRLWSTTGKPMPTRTCSGLC